ncbi:MAG: FliM/FliN family flagellar motor C-terminal domain-containing protein [bacterium]
MADAGLGILRRKVAAMKAQAAEGGPGADRCWRLALARAARDKLKVQLDFRTMTLERRSLAEIMELPPDRSLIAVLDGPDEGLGALVLGPAVMAAFIEAQTMGRVKSSELVARKPTRTDAAMVAGVLDAALQGLETALSDEADLVWAGGFRYASFLDDPRPLGLLLEDVPYRVLQAEVELGGGARHGAIILALPAVGRGRAPMAKEDDAGPAEHGHVFTQALSERVNGSVSRLEAVLARVVMPLAAVMALSEGAVLPLPQAALDQISLEGLDGRRVAEGRLGQNRGMRAVRLRDAAVSGFADQVAGSGAAQDKPAPDLPSLDDLGTIDGGFPAMNIDPAMFQATGTD